jgi:tRNA U34 5-methylaminomethyl-2-thiouridine-forming methyltransferase MnmC
MAIFLTEDGSHSVLSEQFGVTYHSTHGAIQETQHVFIDAGLKNVLLQNLDEIAVLDIGFGTGLNALMTFVEAERLGLKMRYIAYEKYPLSIEAAKTLNFNAVLGISNDILTMMHTCSWDIVHQLTPQFSFEKRLSDIENIDIKNSINLIYFDAFAPEVQPQLWEQPMMQKMYDALCPKGVLTTYCAKGIVKRALRAVGFHVEGLPGPPFKREITRAHKLLFIEKL